jgi:hypothetical protein
VSADNSINERQAKSVAVGIASLHSAFEEILEYVGVESRPIVFEDQ